MKPTTIIAASLLLAVLLAGCNATGPGVGSSGAEEPFAQKDGYFVHEQHVEGYGNCTFLVYKDKVGMGAAGGVVLIGCDGVLAGGDT